MAKIIRIGDIEYVLLGTRTQLIERDNKKNFIISVLYLLALLFISAADPAPIYDFALAGAIFMVGLTKSKLSKEIVI